LNTELNTELNTDFPPCLIPEDANVIQQHIHRWIGLNGKTGLTQQKPKSPAGFDFREKFWLTPKIGMACTRQPITSSVQASRSDAVG
jgi:hypothetical protein